MTKKNNKPALLWSHQQRLACTLINIFSLIPFRVPTGTTVNATCAITQTTCRRLGSQSPRTIIIWARPSVTPEPHSLLGFHVLKGIKWEDKSRYPKSPHSLPPRCAFGQVPTRRERPAGFSKFRRQHVATTVHDWGSQDWLESILCECSSWGQSFTQTKHSIPNLGIYLCSIINYRNCRATQSFQRHVCLKESSGARGRR